jgi:hypothetical protein
MSGTGQFCELLRHIGIIGERRFPRRIGIELTKDGVRDEADLARQEFLSALFDTVASTTRSTGIPYTWAFRGSDHLRAPGSKRSNRSLGVYREMPANVTGEAEKRDEFQKKTACRRKVIPGRDLRQVDWLGQETFISFGLDYGTYVLNVNA